ncbi:hypothetical protein ACA910_014789 [Epithemia clementina (nom. ined.)]
MDDFILALRDMSCCPCSTVVSGGDGKNRQSSPDLYDCSCSCFPNPPLCRNKQQGTVWWFELQHDVVNGRVRRVQCLICCTEEAQFGWWSAILPGIPGHSGVRLYQQQPSSLGDQHWQAKKR